MLSIEEECIPISFVIVIKFTQEDGFDWQIGYDGCSLEGNEPASAVSGLSRPYLEYKSRYSSGSLLMIIFLNGFQLLNGTISDLGGEKPMKEK